MFPSDLFECRGDLRPSALLVSSCHAFCLVGSMNRLHPVLMAMLLTCIPPLSTFIACVSDAFCELELSLRPIALPWTTPSPHSLEVDRVIAVKLRFKMTDSVRRCTDMPIGCVLGVGKEKTVRGTAPGERRVRHHTSLSRRKSSALTLVSPFVH